MKNYDKKLLVAGTKDNTDENNPSSSSTQDDVRMICGVRPLNEAESKFFTIINNSLTYAI